jgi:hypothetical protein
MENPHPSPPVHEEEILVNEQTVKIQSREATGIEIKRAAIAQGVAIQEDFVLSIEIGERKSRIVGDEEVVKLHHGSRFIAVAPDDNS